MKYEHLYVHVPFCARRCAYCDFSIAVRPNVPAREYVGALTAEWKTRHSQSTFALRTLYFGGGTPSKLGGEGVARLMDAVRERASIVPDAEVTLEANPEDVSASAVTMWREAGVNRLSIGVQSFDDRVLKWMHRTHDAAAAAAAVATARDAGVANLSIDLIFAAPASVEREWSRDLDAALSLKLPHISVYGLTVEPQTPLGRWVARRETVEAPEESFASEFLLAHERITASGLEHYEVSNYGLAGQHSRHNWSYWQRRPYAGMGPSAHEFDGATRRWNIDAFAEWSDVAIRGEDTGSGDEDLKPEQADAETIYLGLRSAGGIKVTDEVRERARRWVDEGWAYTDGEVLRLTPTGWLRLDTLASDLTMLRSRY